MLNPAAKGIPEDLFGTRSVPMWRVSEFAYTEKVDFLTNHNSASFGGMAGLLNNNGLTLWNQTNPCIEGIRHLCVFLIIWPRSLIFSPKVGFWGFG